MTEGSPTSSPKNTDAKNCITFLKRMSSGYYKKASEEDKKSASLGLTIYKDQSDEERKLFVQAFKLRDGNKDFTFARDYSEKRSANKHGENSTTENWCTRTTHIGLSHGAFYCPIMRPLGFSPWGLQASWDLPWTY